MENEIASTAWESPSCLENSHLKMVVSYSWTIPQTTAEVEVFRTGILPFKNEDVFCFAAKCCGVRSGPRGCRVYENSITLFLGAVNLHKFGLKMNTAIATAMDWSPSFRAKRTMSDECNVMTNESMSEESTFQAFTTNFCRELDPARGTKEGDFTIKFDILLEKRSEHFSYYLTDSLLGDQLSEAYSKGLHYSDFTVKADTTCFETHKAVLAARSTVFAAMFNSRTAESFSSLAIDVSDGTLEKFLKYLYTGTPEGSCEDKDLLQLAKKYEMDSLKRLCEDALQIADSREVSATMMNILSKGRLHGTHKNSNTLRSPPRATIEVPSDSNRITADDTKAYYSCELDVKFKPCQEIAFKSDTFYLGECPLFNIAIQPRKLKSRRGRFIGRNKAAYDVTIAVISCCSGFYNIEKVIYSYTDDDDHFTVEMELLSDGSASIKIFEATIPEEVALADVGKELHYRLRFFVQLTSKCHYYTHNMVEMKWYKDVLQYRSEPFADIVIKCGACNFAANRLILSARSPVFAAELSASPLSAKAVLVVDADPLVFEQFLGFLYTGKISHAMCVDKGKELQALASKYDVKCLASILSNFNPSTSSNALFSAFASLAF